ncbi:MAG: replicative DNA helicase [Chitinophagaceae bacterium]|nr:replicative DNA helicase [Chitinophagaceae bacterium]
MTDKIPPQALDIEDAVLGAMLIDSNCLNIAMSKLFTEVFYREANALIFQAIETLYDKGQPVDILTVCDQMRRDGSLEQCGGSYYITRLTNNVTSGANIEYHSVLLCEFYLKRQAINITGAANNDLYLDEKDVFDIINQADAAMQQAQEKVLQGQARDMAYFSVKVLEQHDSVKSTGVLGISTGLKSIDEAICGLVPPDVIVIAARPGQGKTALALSITHNASIIGKVPCLWISLEMDGVQLTRRLASIDTGINHEVLRNGKTTTDEYNTFQKSLDLISRSKVFIEDRTSINIRDIRTRAYLLKKRNNIGYIVVDYLQLMSGVTRNPSREQEIAEISRGLKCLSKELGVPIIALSQLSREVEKRPDKMPQLSDLRESGAIEQDADEVLFLMRPEYYKMTEDVNIGGKSTRLPGYVSAQLLKTGTVPHGTYQSISKDPLCTSTTIPANMAQK